MKRTKIIVLILILLVLCAGLAAGISAIVCRSALTVKTYDMPIEGVEQPFTAVCITDLHSREFGEDNAKLLEQIRAQQPDVIFTLGDLISRDATREEIACMGELLRRLREIAPVISSLGNHEEDYMRITGTDLRPVTPSRPAPLTKEHFGISIL